MITTLNGSLTDRETKLETSEQQVIKLGNKNKELEDTIVKLRRQISSQQGEHVDGGIDSGVDSSESEELRHKIKYLTDELELTKLQLSNWRSRAGMLGDGTAKTESAEEYILRLEALTVTKNVSVKSVCEAIQNFYFNYADEINASSNMKNRFVQLQSKCDWTVKEPAK